MEDNVLKTMLSNTEIDMYKSLMAKLGSYIKDMVEKAGTIEELNKLDYRKLIADF